MPKIELWRLGQGEVFKFNENSDEFALVDFDVRFMDDPKDHQIANIKNLRTGRISQSQVFFCVYTPPYQFSQQLSLF